MPLRLLYIGSICDMTKQGAIMARASKVLKAMGITITIMLSILTIALFSVLVILSSCAYLLRNM